MKIIWLKVIKWYMFYSNILLFLGEFVKEIFYFLIIIFDWKLYFIILNVYE